MNIIKKILIVLLVFVGITSISIVYGAGESNNPCVPDLEGGYEIGDTLDKCLEKSALVSGKDAKISGGVGTKIKVWVDNISLYLLIFAVGSIVYGSLMMTLSAGDDEKIKKAKDIVKWGIIGFIGLISASAIINLVVKIMYSI